MPLSQTTLVLEGRAEKAGGVNVEAEGTTRAKAQRWGTECLQEKWEEASPWEQRVCACEGGVGSMRARQRGPAQSGCRAKRAWMNCPRWCFREVSHTDWTGTPVSRQSLTFKQAIFLKLRVCYTNVTYMVHKVSSVRPIFQPPSPPPSNLTSWRQPLTGIASSI